MYRILDEEKKAILCINRVPDFEELCLKMKIAPETFSSRTLWKIYRDIFIYSLELKSLYLQFYSIEYSSFYDYLAISHSIEMKENELFESESFFLIEPKCTLLEPAYKEEHFESMLKLLSEEY